MGYVLSGFSDEYADAFDEQLKGFNKLGIKYLELRFIDGVNVADLTEEQVSVVKAKLNNAGIKVSAIGSPIGKIELDDDFSDHLIKAERVFKTAKELSCDKVRIFSFYLGNKTRKESEKEVLSRLTALIESAGKYGITLCHENEAKIYGEDPDHCLYLMEYFKGKLKCVFDMGNFRIDGYDPKIAYEKLKCYIEYFHIKDATENGVIVPCGEGDAKIKEILKAYNSEKPTFISLEPHLVDFTGLNILASHALLKQRYSFSAPSEAFTYATYKAKELLRTI